MSEQVSKCGREGKRERNALIRNIPPLLLSQIDMVASKLAAAILLPQGDQATKINKSNK